MSLCDTCPDPGHYCRGFPLSIEVDVLTSREELQKQLDSEGLGMFRPLRRIGASQEYGKTRWNYTCVNLGNDGRCMDYENRPHPCVHYEPGTDALCVLSDESEFSYTAQDWEVETAAWYQRLDTEGKSFLHDLLAKAEEKT